ncbi:DUF2642 domain-containing protein [Paenibacillus macerans]|uniref:DUF2642 domain-containing protein n=1 Tax=Paenibacillus macerans TaxID=44252 RepID=UPI003D31358E
MGVVVPGDSQIFTTYLLYYFLSMQCSKENSTRKHFRLCKTDNSMNSTPLFKFTNSTLGCNSFASPFSTIFPVPMVPQPNQYVTRLDPVFVDHLSRHKGRPISLMTTAGKLEGILSGIAIDHVQLSMDHKAIHVRIAQIVYFEGLPVSYR